ncbi:MAG: 16S rRNA (guanine(527)-N(7))-methyltransferase RsmG [Erysipelotrichaceae bacterium]|nr:16S rRNA (guanine(527)-N(7))-methyltransferase RsmG [Erysipelotrichaceae bacterium]
MNKDVFIKELINLNITLTNEQLSKLEKYYEILVEENQKYNLTAITNKEEVYLKHFYDSLTISKIVKLNDQELCDIGTGAGFPGIVLKIAYPNLKVTLVEATEKKCNFLKLVIEKLNLKDIHVINERAEIYSKEVREKYDIVTSRAVAPLKHLLEYSIPLVKVNGLYIAMKSDITNEIKEISIYEQKLKIKEVKRISFSLPIENSLRTLIMYHKSEKTNPKYPRKYNEIKKKSL